MSRVIVLFLVTLFFSCSKHPKADQIVIGKIWTSNEKQPYAEAMAISGDTIVAIGTKSEIEKWKGDQTAEIIAPEGQLITPGFIDSHTHFVDGGFNLSSVKLRYAKTPKEFITILKDYATTVPAGTWILGGDWDHQNWGGEMPKKEWIDSVSKNNPVAITRFDGHMTLLNSVALKLANIKDNVAQVSGGEVVKEKGKLTGIFKDNAHSLFVKKITIPTEAQQDKALALATDYMLENGITSVASMTGTGYGDYFNLYKRAKEQGNLRLRIYAAHELEDWRTLDAMVKKEGKGDKWLRFGGLKGFVDGSLGSHTASFLKPFTDVPTDSGFFVTPKEILYKRVKSADSAGLHPIVHAIGDKAIRTLLDIFEQVEKENGKKDSRFRIEHAQHIHPDDMKRFKELGVIASVQPYHAIDDGRWAEKVIGHERSMTTYAFKSLMDAGATVAFGSDWFVAPASPMEGIYAAVTRRTIDDKTPDGWIPEQKVTVEQALKAYTFNAAYATFEDNIKGSLEPGKLADYVILEKDITKIDPVEIRSVKILKTIVGGKTAYEKKD